jgi:hypothetical protein
MGLLQCPCPLMALSGHCSLHRTCPLSGVKRTLLLALQMSANDPKRTSSGRGHPWMDTKLRGRSFVPGAQAGKSGLNSHRPFGGIACFITTLIEKGPPSGDDGSPPPNERCQHWGHGDGALTALTEQATRLRELRSNPSQMRAPGARPGSGTRTLSILSTKAQIECDYSNNSKSCGDSNPNTYSPLLGKRIALRCTHPWPQRCTTNVCPNFLPNPIAIRLRRAQA